MNDVLFRDGETPFFPLGLQCCNSSAFNASEMKAFWDSVAFTGVNTVEIPVYWETFEPEQNLFCYEFVDECLRQADLYDVKVIFLWFGSWKNGTSKYAPTWIKENPGKYKRVVTYEGIVTNILSPYCRENLEADKAAFLKLVQYIEQNNRKKNRVIGIQIENEPGMMMRGDRDCGPIAETLFQEEVPDEVKSVVFHHELGEVTDIWKEKGALTDGCWTDLFGEKAGEYFSVFGIASYIQELAAEAKRITDLTMIVNVWTDNVGWDEPGVDYPAGGPVSKVLGLWKMFAPDVDVVGLDNYKLDREGYLQDCQRYSKYGNPLFLPESHAWDEANSQTMFWAVGRYKAKGLFLFGPEAMYSDTGEIKPCSAEIIKSIKALVSIQSVLPHFINSGGIWAVVQEDKMTEQKICQGDAYIRIFFEFERTDYHHGYFGTKHGKGRGLLLRENANTYYAVGEGINISIRQNSGILYSRQRMDKYIGYKKVEEGYFDKQGRWICTRRRNGDESDYGIWVTSDVGAVKIELEEVKHCGEI